MAKKMLRWEFWLFVLLFGAAFALSFAHWRHYRPYQSAAFSYRQHETYNPYEDHTPMEEITFKRLERFYGWFLVLEPPDLESITHYPLPFSITYYTREGDQFVPALTLEKGTELLVFPSGKIDHNSAEPGYGFKSWPTYWKGWRYVKPFLPAGEFLSEDTPYYYVKLEDLEAFLYQILTESSWASYFREMTEEKGFGWTMWDTVQGFTRHADYGMYLDQFYYSPDFWHPLWNPVLTVLGLMAAASGGGWFLLVLKERKTLKADKK